MASSSSFHRAFSEIEPTGIRRTAEESSRMFDVFINHRGPDVKETLAVQLYNLLKELGIRAFLDSEEKELGISFPSTIETAIHSASVHVAIFSERYAESAWCLEELFLMLQSRAKIIPVFYGVKPSDLRYIEKGVYADAFTKHDEKGRYYPQKLREWKEALQSVSFTAGHEFNNFNVGDCKNIVLALQKEVERKKMLYVAKYPVGLHKLVKDFERRCLDELVQEFDSQCRMNKNSQGKAQIVGIFGMGGVGKTTLSKELFNRKRSQYSRACFLFDVREFSTKSNLPSLQMKLLRDIFHEDHLNFQGREEGTSFIWNSIERSSFLSFIIVLDDVDHLEQLDALLIMDILNKSVNSLIIITTRDVGVLISAGIKDGYHLKGMDKDDARELFCWHAFQQPHPASGYEDLVENFLGVCGGLPLSLQVLGSHVHGRDQNYWRLEVNKVSQTLHQDIKQKLKISFDALGSQEKQIFMDIACFFDEELKCIAMRVWKASGWSAQIILKRLKDKSLVVEEIDDTKLVLRMHQHLRDLGREMADELSHPRRFWHPRDLKSLESKGFEKILTQTKGRCFHSIFDKSINSEITFFLGESDDSAERSSFLLWLHLEYLEYQDDALGSDSDDALENDLNFSIQLSIPSWIPLQNLEFLRISNGCLERLWQRDVQAPLQLKELEIYGTFLKGFPDFLGILTNLEKEAIDAEQIVIEDGPSIGSLTMDIPALHLSDVRKSGIVKTPLSFLEDLVISDQEKIIMIVINGNHCPNLQSFDISHMKNLIEVQFTRLETLNCLKVTYCKDLKRLSGTSDLTKLVELNISACPEIKELSLHRLSCLERLTIVYCNDLKSVSGISHLAKLVELNISRCSKLQLELCLVGLNCLKSIKLDESIRLECFELNGCKSLKTISGKYALQKLQFLNIRDCPELKSLPVFLGASCLQRITIDGCGKLNYLELSDCQNLNRLSGNFNLVELKISACPKLEELSLGRLSYLQRITIVYCKDLKSVSGISELTKLAELNISQCWKLQLELCLAGLNCLKRIKFDKSVKLKSFELNGCQSLKAVSGTYDLEKIQLINIRDCPKLEELPVFHGPSCLERITIYGCEKLSLLYLRHLSCLVRINIDGCGKLSYLELRYCEKLEGVSGNFNVVGLSISDCPKLEELTCFPSLTCFEKMRIFRCGKLQNIPLPTTLNHLELNVLPEFQRVSAISALTNLVELNISECYSSFHRKNVSECWELEQLSVAHLKLLEKLTIANLKSISGISNLTNLVELNISHCWELELELCLSGLNRLKRVSIVVCGKMHTMTLPTRLIELTLQDCKDLKMVAGISTLTKLAKLSIKSCPQLQHELHLFGLNCLETIAIVECAKLQNITLPTTLMKLTVQLCRKLQTVTAIGDLTKLTDLNISHCPQLEELPSREGLSCLERITIDSCKKLEDIKRIDEFLILERMRLPRLKVFISRSLNRKSCFSF